MATKVLSNEFMQNISMKDAWKELSSDFGWSEAMLEKYQDKVDWDDISDNRHIRWTIPMIQKFQKKINWDKLSVYIDKDILTENMLEAFKDKWNWHELSGNYKIKIDDEMLTKYADRWDWNRIMNRYIDDVFEGNGIDFYEKYKDYISINEIQSSCLWRGIVRQQAKQLLEEITA